MDITQTDITNTRQKHGLALKGMRGRSAILPATPPAGAHTASTITSGDAPFDCRPDMPHDRLRHDTSRAAEEISIEAELLGTVSHELRTPLTAIKGYATTLLRHEERLPQTERHEFLEAIGHASDRLETVIDQLLEMSELEAGSVTLQRFPVDIERSVDEAVFALRERIHNEIYALLPGPFSGSFTFVVTRQLDATNGEARDASAPWLVNGDARRLRHVLDQVLENAVKFSPGGGTIDVTLRTRTPDACATVSALAGRPKHQGDLVEIEIHDRGMGIPAEHLDRVFERFHRIDTRLARESEGLGLGLAIARRIVELHGGVIWAQSTPGDGAAFHICLPLATEVEAEVESDGHQRAPLGVVPLAESSPESSPEWSR